jgi:hypothetical protein
MNTKRRAIFALLAAAAILIGIAVFGSNAGATSYYEDEHQCYTSDCEVTTTTEYVEETTTTVQPTTTTVVPETTTTTVPVTTTMPELPTPELIPPLIIERELPPYVAPVTPIQPEKPISFTG